MENRSFTVCKACSAHNAPSLKSCHRCEAHLVHNQRRFERTEVRIPGTAVNTSGGTHEVEVLNLGMGGVLFRCDRPYSRDDMIRIQFPLDGDCFTVEAEVRHCQEDFQGYYVGAEFAATSPPFIFKLHAMLKAAG